MTEVKQKGGQQQGRSFGRTLQHGLVMGLALMSSVEAAFCPPPKLEAGERTPVERLGALLEARAASVPSGAASAAAAAAAVADEAVNQQVHALLSALTDEDIRALPPEMIQQFGTEDLACLSPAQIGQFSHDQQGAITGGQVTVDHLRELSWAIPTTAQPAVTREEVLSFDRSLRNHLWRWPDKKLPQLLPEDIVALVGNRAEWDRMSVEERQRLLHAQDIPAACWPVMPVAILAQLCESDHQDMPEAAWPDLTPPDIVQLSDRDITLQCVQKLGRWPRMDVEHLIAMPCKHTLGYMPADCWPDTPLTEEQIAQHSSGFGLLQHLPARLWPQLSCETIVNMHVNDRYKLPDHAWPELGMAEFMTLAAHNILRNTPVGRYPPLSVRDVQEIARVHALGVIPFWLLPDLTDEVIAELGGLTRFLEHMRRNQQEAAARLAREQEAAAAAEPLAKPVRAPKRT